jgi:hypothetical protein
VLLYLERDVFSSVQLAHILPAVASIDPCAQQQKLVKLVLPVENLMYSSVNLDGGYMKRSFVFSQWFPQLRKHCQQGIKIMAIKEIKVLLQLFFQLSQFLW